MTYALYHGDTFIDLGTAEHLAELLGVKVQTVKFYGYQSWLERTDYRGYVLVRIEEDDE